MNILEIITIIVLVALTLTMFYGLYVHEQWKNFNRHLKKGDPVDVYLGEVRTTYHIEKVGEIFCEIKVESGTIIKVERTSLYPKFSFDYKPEEI